MDTKSKWSESKIPRFQKLNNNHKCEVLVIGGGITGLTTAYILAKEGRKVCLIERERLGGIDTSHTTAHLTCVTDARISELVRNFGKDNAQKVWRAGEDAINTIEKIVEEESIDCDFKRVPGYLLSSLVDSREDSRLKKDYNWARNLDFDARYPAAVPYFKKAGVHFPKQALIHPVKFMAGLAEKIIEYGGEIYEQTEAGEFSGQYRVEAGSHTIDADYVVIATHVPLVGATPIVWATLFQTKLALYSSYVIGAKLPRDIVKEGCYWDTKDPYYYLRVEAKEDHDYAIFGGRDHKTGQINDTIKCYAELESDFLKVFPVAKVDYRWSGQVVETHDGLPFIGENIEKQFISSGFSGNGITFGTLAALMASDAIAGRENTYKTLFSPGRFKLIGGAYDYMKENADYPIYMIKDRLQGVPKAEGTPITSGEGKLVNIDGQKTACYCDESGKVTCMSAVCPHMGGIVHWNAAEKTWDCPCHGSRFHATGEVMTGPAESGLEALNENVEEGRPIPVLGR